MLMVVVKASIRQASMELQIERSFSFRFTPLSVFLLCSSIYWFLLVRSERFTGVVISALVVHDGQSFPCKTVHVYFLAETGQEKKDMSRSALIIQRSIQHHGTMHNNNGSLVRLYCVDEHRNGPSWGVLFWSEWSPRLIYSMGAPCIHSAWYSFPLFVLHYKNALSIFIALYIYVCVRVCAAAEPEILNKGGRADTLYYTWETYQDIYTCY